MKLSEFDFDLPERLIAVRPAVPRSAAKMLVAEGVKTRDMVVTDLVSVLRAGDHLVLNDTKVIPARLFGERSRQSEHGSGIAKIEVTLLEPQADGTWGALIKP
ncbi:MAG TPA: tRNA preQ1(34) S-adenosylmethionine ribosyltransferase-isomerase QueA, partial [Octadecabacter sp.]|nr:tRNA preQ1(34) S-adenosylmethionine ribosyltransferase-isomerase QueA [Octadecabacter sp.]